MPEPYHARQRSVDNPLIMVEAVIAAHPSPRNPMNLRSFLQPGSSRLAPVAVLIARVATGLILVPHGVSKVFGGGAAGLAAMLAQKGAPFPILLAWCSSLAELFGGLFLALGLLTRPAAIVVALNMIVAWATVHLAQAADIGTAKGGLFEYPFLLSILAVAFAVGGPGQHSLDARIFGDDTERR